MTDKDQVEQISRQQMQRPWGKNNLGPLKEKEATVARIQCKKNGGRCRQGSDPRALKAKVERLGFILNAMGGRCCLRGNGMSDWCFTKMNESLCLLMEETRGESEKPTERLVYQFQPGCDCGLEQRNWRKVRLSMCFSGRASRIFCDVLYTGGWDDG